MLLLKLCYFFLFFAKGSLYPFLGLLLRARGCNMFLIGIAMNTSAITRLLSGPAFFAAAAPPATTAQQAGESFDSVLSRLQAYIIYCVFFAMASALLFVYAVAHPLISAFCVGTIMGALALTSLFLDSTVVRDLVVDSEKKDYLKSTADDHKQEQQQQHHQDDDHHGEITSAAGFGETRMYGSLGWGLGAVLQVLFISKLYRNLKSHPGAGDAAAWFSVSEQEDFPNGSKNRPSLSVSSSETMIGSIFIFVFSLSVFLFVLRRVFQTTTPLVCGHHEEEGGGEAGAEFRGRVELGDDEQQKQQKESVQHQNDFVSHVLKFSPALSLALLYGICDSATSTFLFPYLKEPPRSVNTAVLSWIPAVNVLSELPVLFFSRRIHSFFPSITAMHSAMLVLWALRLATYAILENHAAKIVFFVEILNGFCFAGAFVLCIRHVIMLCHGDTKQVSFALVLIHGAFFGASALVVAVVGGLVAQLLGTCLMFMVLGLICAGMALRLGGS